MLRNPAGNLYEIAAQQLLAAGIRNVDLAYAFFFNLPPRTVRRIFERCECLMGNGVEEDQLTEPYPLGTAELEGLQAAAGEARVPARVALSAVLRFGNPLERVRSVLTDIRALIVSQCAPRNPAGLFVSLMRSGESVSLPERVLLARQVGIDEAEARQAAEIAAEQKRAQEAALEVQALSDLDTTATLSPAEQWRQRGPSLRLHLRGWPKADLERLEAACCTGQLSAATLAREWAAAQARGEVEAWAGGLRGRLG